MPRVVDEVKGRSDFGFTCKSTFKAELKAARGFLCNAAVACRWRSSALRSSKKSADTEVFVAERSDRRWHAVAMFKGLDPFL